MTKNNKIYVVSPFASFTRAMEANVFHPHTKSILVFINILVIVMGMCIFACGLFVLCSNQGGINPSLFNFVGSISMLYGFIITELSHMSHRSLFIYGKVDGNTEKLIKGLSNDIFRTGPRITAIVLVLTGAIMIGEILFLSYCYSTYSRLQDIYSKSKHESINDFSSPSLDSHELKISHIFNDLYFEAVSSCSCKYNMSLFFPPNL